MADFSDLNYGETLRGLRAGMRVFNNRYALKRKLGRGGMGEVWLAEDTELEEEVALKFLPEVARTDPGALDDLRRETRKSRRLTHPNIVRVHDFLVDQVFAAISMEYIEGKTLTELRLEKTNKVFEIEDVKSIVFQACDALGYAHEKAKIVHRDLKPANLMVDTEGDLKITDFGISASITDTVTRVSVQLSSSGTPVYMSPQQMMGDDPSVSDDVYSLGATLYELFTGKPPFYTGNILLQVQSKVPPKLSDRRAALNVSGDSLPECIEACVSLCLFKEQKGRPNSMTDLYAVFEGTHHSPEDDNELEHEKSSKKLERKSELEGYLAADDRLKARGPVSKGEEKYLSNLESGDTCPVEGKEWMVPHLNLEMVWIGPGEFVMGSPMSERGRCENEIQHTVCITKGYWLGKYPVTQAQWRAVVESDQNELNGAKQLNFPVEKISWEEAMSFCQELSACERNVGRLTHSLEYCLPTEAEWEYACRAGINADSSGLSLSTFGWNGENSKGKTHPVGEKRPNGWGVYDMHGNVSEWCSDWFGDYPRKRVLDPMGPPKGSGRVIRGGSWSSSARYCRAASRYSAKPADRLGNLGFRLCLRFVDN